MSLEEAAALRRWLQLGMDGATVRRALGVDGSVVSVSLVLQPIEALAATHTRRGPELRAIFALAATASAQLTPSHLAAEEAQQQWAVSVRAALKLVDGANSWTAEEVGVHVCVCGGLWQGC